MDYYIGVDLGGTSIKTGIVDENYKISGSGTVPTSLPKTPEEIGMLIKESVDLALKDAGRTMDEIKWAGIGIPGIVDAKNGVVGFASNFNFRDVKMAEISQRLLGVPVYIENDANAAIYGEMLNGSAKGCKNVVMLTLGTGVGGGVIINGSIYSGFNSQGAELGHVGIFYGGEKCLCGHTGCIEMYCSATALIKQTKRAMELAPESILWDMAKGSLDNVDGRIAFDAMRKGDKAAKSVVSQYTDYLGYAVVNYINIFQPEMIVLGGGISYQKDIILEPLREYARKHALGYTPESHTKIECVSLGNDAGIIGAAFLGQSFS